MLSPSDQTYTIGATPSVTVTSIVPKLPSQSGEVEFAATAKLLQSGRQDGVGKATI